MAVVSLVFWHRKFFVFGNLESILRGEVSHSLKSFSWGLSTTAYCRLPFLSCTFDSSWWSCRTMACSQCVVFSTYSVRPLTMPLWHQRTFQRRLVPNGRQTPFLHVTHHRLHLLADLTRVFVPYIIRLGLASFLQTSVILIFFFYFTFLISSLIAQSLLC